MIEQRQPRIPMPVAAASLILPLTAAIQVGQMLTKPASRADGLQAGVFALGMIVLVLAVAYGLWQRVKRALRLAAYFSAFSIAYGFVGLTEIDALWLLRTAGFAVTVGLLLVPASSREWYRKST